MLKVSSGLRSVSGALFDDWLRPVPAEIRDETRLGVHGSDLSKFAGNPSAIGRFSAANGP
jgi:hypothetical protein